MASDTAAGSMSGLSPTEAAAFHKYFMQYFGIFVAIALVAHLLVWLWRPWIPGEAGWEAVVSSATQFLTPLSGFLA